MDSLLAGLFETADDQFQQIRDQRQVYVNQVRESTKEPKEFLQTELNLDSLHEYLQWRFPDLPVVAFNDQLRINLSTLQKAGYQRLADLQNALDEDLLSRATSAMNEMTAVERVDGKIPASAFLVCALSLGNQKLLDSLSLLSEQKQILEKYSRKLSGSKRSQGDSPIEINTCPRTFWADAPLIL